MKDLKEIQNKILSYNPESYYRIYKLYEFGYCGKIFEWIKKQNPVSIIDIGGGYGTFCMYCRKLFPNSYIRLVDIVQTANFEMLKENNIDLCLCDIEKSIPDGTYDIVIFTEILEHLTFNPVDTINKIKKLLNPKGKLYLSTPDVNSWGRLGFFESHKDMIDGFHFRPDLKFEHIYHYSKEELKELLKDFKINKFEIINNDWGNHFNLELEVM